MPPSIAHRETQAISKFIRFSFESAVRIVCAHPHDVDHPIHFRVEDLLGRTLITHFTHSFQAQRGHATGYSNDVLPVTSA